MITKSSLRELTHQTIGCIIEVHRQLGPGLLESVYHLCLMSELRQNGISFQSQVHIPVHYKGEDLGGKLVIDLLIENILILELKSVEAMIPLYKAQLLSYLKLSDISKGLLVNFNCEVIKDQIKSVVTEKYRGLKE